MNPQPTTQRKWRWLLGLLQVIIVILAAAIGYLGHDLLSHKTDNLGLLQQAQKILLKNTILEIPEPPALEYGMIQGMLSALNDPHTFFVTPAAHEVASDQLAGSYGGIGVRLERDTAGEWRLYPLPESQALAAGILDGDLLLKVDDLTITQDTDEVILLAALRGPIGEKVSLLIQREDVALSFRIRRESVPIPSVVWNLLPEDLTVGLIRVNRIAETTPDEIKTGIQDLQSQGATAFILDLRDNGGGLVDAGVAISRLFLTEGDIVQREFKDEKVKVFEVEKPGPYTDLPLAVLVNGNTASSAEILAGSLASHGRATLIGAPTYGKTTIQYVFDLQDGSSIHVTSGRWWIAGVNFPLIPDIVINLDDPNVNIIETALSVLK